MDNLAYNDRYDREELLNGQIVAMSPRPTVNHNIVAGNIFGLFRQYLLGKPCIAFADGTEVNLTEKDRVIPDTMIVCNRDIIRRNGIYGAPDLIVEVLSESTAHKDKGYKKNLYEKCGVKEYWIIEPRLKTVEVYTLNEGKYELFGIYYDYPESELAEMDEEERSKILQEIKVPLFENLTIAVSQIFEKTL